MLINQQARLAANSLRQRRPSQGDRNKIATILEECATALEEMEPNADAKEMAKDRFPKDTVEQETVEVVEDGKQKHRRKRSSESVKSHGRV